MKTQLLNFANRIGDAARRTAPGRLLVSKTIELASRIVNGESCSLWYESGVWFRCGKDGKTPIGIPAGIQKARNSVTLIREDP